MGNVTSTPPAWEGTIKDKMVTYDFSNPETIGDLIKGAEKKLMEYAPLDGVQLDPKRCGY